MPTDIKREFLTGPRTFNELMEKLEIIINDMMSDDGPVPMDLGLVGTHDAKKTQSDSDTSNDMIYEDVCNRLERVQSRQWNGQERIEQAGSVASWKKELMNGRVAEEMTEARKEARMGPRAANLIGTVTRTKEALEKKGKARARVKPDTASTTESKDVSE